MRPCPSRLKRLPRAGLLAAMILALPLAAVAADPAPKKAAAGAGWNTQLLQCKDKAGSNVVEREKCVWKYCEGHWGQGACPPGENKPAGDTATAARLDKCKADAGFNLIQREKCVWQVCEGRWGQGACPKKAESAPKLNE